MKETVIAVDFSVEFAHVHVDAAFSSEHRQSARLARLFLGDVAHDGQSATLVLLVDDYNPSLWTLDLEDFVGRLGSAGAQPDQIIRESSLTTCVPALLKVMAPRTRREHERYHQRHGKYACSLLVAAFNLVRVGALEPPPNLVLSGATSVSASSLVSILPSRYLHIEKRAMDIVACTPFCDVAESIRHVWF